MEELLCEKSGEPPSEQSISKKAYHCQCVEKWNALVVVGASSARRNVLSSVVVYGVIRAGEKEGGMAQDEVGYGVGLSFPT